MARILVVDDNPENVALIELYLRGTEFEVVSASGGHEAIELSMRESFELILLDVVMPVIDGFEVCRRLKNDPRTAFVPVIFLTGRMGDESEKLAAYQLGAVDYIQKPVDRDELVARIRVMLRLEDARSRLDRENAALRAHLETLEERLGAAAGALGDLENLREEWASDAEPEVVVLAADDTVEAFDPGVADLLPGVARGRSVAGCGAFGERLAAAIARGERSTRLFAPREDGGQRCVLVSVRQADRRVVVLRDVTRIRAAEQRLAGRAMIAPLPQVSESSGYRMTEVVGGCAQLERLTASVDRLRQSRATVLIYGESGTGKELIARALHFDGRYRSAPFVPLHCGAIAPELIESELFGHEKGSFTGAQQAHEGLFRAADGGTVFLDEIALTPPSLQVKLLRVLQRGEIRAVGATHPRIVDVRIIAATNRDLRELVREGRFREDLYYRLEVVTLELPPLRERMGDLQLLVEHFLRVGNRRHDRLSRPVRGISQGAMERMLAYSWPGNVRELENVVERAFALGIGEILRADDLPRHVLSGVPMLELSPVTRGPMGLDGTDLAPTEPFELGSVAARSDLRTRREAFDRDAIVAALRETRGDKVEAATRLGMARSTFYRRLKELGL